MRRPGEVASPRSAIDTLDRCFALPLEHARAQHAAGARVIGAAAHATPWELLRAAGFAPIVLRPTRRGGRFCGEYLEPGIFSPRIRALFESVLAGDLAFLSALVFARTSEQDYKAYLYLREVAREGHSDGFPPLWFYDLLHSPSAHAFEYGLARTHALIAQLESVTGHAMRPDDLQAAIAESNAARAAVRRLLSLRQKTPRVTGTEALPLVGAFFLMDRPTYAALAARAADDIEQRAPLPGPRLMLAGAWLDHEELHALLESHGAVVVAEEGGWGTRGAGHDIVPDADPVTAIFEKYYRDGPSVRQFPPADRAWISATDPADIDGVVFYLPPDDSVAGWDVPAERQRLDRLGIPSLVIRDDLNDPQMGDRWHERIAAFVQRAARGREWR